MPASPARRSTQADHSACSASGAATSRSSPTARSSSSTAIPARSFTSFIPKSGNWGLTFAPKRFTLTARWNYRGLDKRAPMAAYGPNGYEYIQARTVLDVSTSFQLTKRLSLIGSANNIFNKPMRFLRYGDLTPAYARQYAEQEYGIQMAVGLRGSF